MWSRQRFKLCPSYLKARRVYIKTSASLWPLAHLLSFALSKPNQLYRKNLFLMNAEHNTRIACLAQHTVLNSQSNCQDKHLHSGTASYRPQPSRLALALTLGLGIGLWAPAFAVPPTHWSEGVYAYNADRATVQKVLGDFARTMGVRLEMAPGASGSVNGRVAGNNPIEFLDRLCSANGLNWFLFNGTLYISREAENITVTLTSTGTNPADMQAALQNIGLLEKKFGWGELPGQNAVIVTGPAVYVQLIQRVLEGLPAAPQGMEVAVFRLRYASVDDRQIQVRNQNVTTPGMVTILRSLAGIKNNLDSPGTTNTSNSSTNSSSSSSAPAANDSKAFSGSVPFAPTKRTNTNQQRGPSVEGDSRINAVIVRDVPDMIPVYRKLIQELDQPVPLIEIEAFIIDVDRSRLDDLGIDWLIKRNGNITSQGIAEFGNSTGSFSLARNLIPPLSAASNSSLVLPDSNGLLARLRLLEQQGNARIMAKPSILTMDNSTALLDLSQTFYVQTTGERVASLDSFTTGVMLKVTPRVVDESGARNIHLLIDIEDGNFQDRAGAALPIVQKSTISTQALVPEQESLLIGGYNRETDTDSVSKVPLLGDIPGLGFLFRSRTSNKQIRERMFLISPKVVEIARVGDRKPAYQDRLNAQGINSQDMSLQIEGGMKKLWEQPAGINTKNIDNPAPKPVNSLTVAPPPVPNSTPANPAASNLTSPSNVTIKSITTSTAPLPGPPLANNPTSSYTPTSPSLPSATSSVAAPVVDISRNPSGASIKPPGTASSTSNGVEITTSKPSPAASNIANPVSETVTPPAAKKLSRKQQREAAKKAANPPTTTSPITAPISAEGSVRDEASSGPPAVKVSPASIPSAPEINKP